MPSNPRSGAVSFEGDRFEADVAPSRELVDIFDRKELKRLILLDITALHELHDLSGELIEFVERGR